MIGIIAFILGAIIGALVARHRGGNIPDIVQYALVFGLIAFVLALIFAVVVARYSGAA